MGWFLYRGMKTTVGKVKKKVKGTERSENWNFPIEGRKFCEEIDIALKVRTEDDHERRETKSEV
jgi:hypothetical protein